MSHVKLQTEIAMPTLGAKFLYTSLKQAETPQL